MPTHKINGIIRRRLRGGFTLIELLVVMAIMAVLVAAVVHGGSVLMTRGRVRSTQATLIIVQEAIDQFHLDKPTIVTARQHNGTRMVKYSQRFGEFPPDEFEIFSGDGLTGGAGTGGRALAPGGALVVPSPPPAYGAMTYQTKGLDLGQLTMEHRDLAAMVLAIELYCETGRDILSRLPNRNRTEGVVDDSTGEPAQFLDRNGDGVWDPDDHQIRYLVDDWGVPLVYYAQRDFRVDGLSPTATLSANHAVWNQASTGMIKLNMSRPIIMSYGPDAEHQLSADVLGADQTALLHVDFADDNKVTNSLHEDNVYADEFLAEKLRKGDLR